MTLTDVVQARIYLTVFERDYADMNTVWRGCFAEGRLPARTCIGVTGLARQALVEIDLLAYSPSGPSSS
jgi:enamine deaminase RidA (YjgF/YER057c/UK114 family)